MGRTALMLACANGFDEIAFMLIESGANINAVAKGNISTALHAAASGI